jgi:hypothetical protein
MLLPFCLERKNGLVLIFGDLHTGGQIKKQKNQKSV